MEEIRGITWDFDGEELTHEQTIQRIVQAGFPVHNGAALTMFAIVEGESGEYQRAWHINVERHPNGSIKRFDQFGVGAPTPTSGPVEYMKAKSIDLGFIQFNVQTQNRLVKMEAEPVAAFVEEMFDTHPDLADPWTAARRAYTLYQQRGFTPWYAYKPGTLAFWKKKRYGAMAFAQWHLHSFVGRKDRETEKPLDFQWKETS